MLGGDKFVWSFFFSENFVKRKNGAFLINLFFFHMLPFRDLCSYQFIVHECIFKIF